MTPDLAPPNAPPQWSDLPRGDLAPAFPPYVQLLLERGGALFQEPLTYAIPTLLSGRLRVGDVVAAPLRGGTVVAYVVGWAKSLPFDAPAVREVEAVISDAPLFDDLALKIARWMASYYHCPLLDCLQMWMPAGATPELESKYEFCAPEPLRALRDLARTPKLFALAEALWKAKRPLSAAGLTKIMGCAAEAGDLRRLSEIGVVTVAQTSKTPVKARLLPAVRLTEAGRAALETQGSVLERKAPKQQAALELVAKNPSEWVATGDLLRGGGVEIAPLKALCAKGFLEWGHVEAWRAPSAATQQNGARVELTDEQKVAVDGIAASLENRVAPQTILLQGVTASGKTEVYLHAIEHCLALQKRALVLVPEIALTAQTVEIFQRRFGSQVAILHSALGAGERFDEWRRAASGEARIVVGARSAVFAPIRELGLLIIDEEHDGSYKQDKTPRYHAREVALKRCAMENAVLVLGSATPSLESYSRAVRGEYGHLQMLKRVSGRALPEVEIVDMTGEAKAGVLPVLSRRLTEELLACVERGEQAILFLNRRGFATYVQCLGCGHAEGCPNCDVSLTHHKIEGTLQCHHCDFVKPVPGRCPKCDGWMLGFNGSGTEKVAWEVEQMFSERGKGKVNVLRLDRDTTVAKGAHAQILGEFRQGKAPILIGTQMVTKGLDFPRVTLVGVISADTALNVPDFRASERTFQLLAQVAGRAGRGAIAGRVLIQTLAATDPAITAAANHDFQTFVQGEIEARAVIPNPPFSHAVNVLSMHEDEAIAKQKLERLAAKFNDIIARNGGGTDLLGPVSCPLARVKNKFRFHLLLRDRSRPRLHSVLGAYDALAPEDKEGLILDVDALSIL